MQRLDATLLTACVLATLGLGCGKQDDGAQADTAAADSSQVTAPADSALMAADTTAAPEEAKRSFLARLFKRNGEDEDEKEEPVPVELAFVEVRDMPAYLGTTATLEPDKQAQILAKIDGEIRALHVEEGDWVSAGQVVATLDGAAQQVAYEEANASFHSVESDLARAKELHKEELASEKDLNDAQYKFEQAIAQRKAAQLQVDYTRILAPFAGQITQRYVDPGQTVAPGAALFALVDRDPLLARIHLPEREALKIQPGQKVVISSDTRPTEEVTGDVIRVAPVVDARTGTVKVTCQVDGRNEKLRPGSFVRVRVQTDMRRGVLAIPKRAMVQEGGETYVFCVEADSVRKLPILTGLTNHKYVEITGGLTGGEQVVTVGHGALKTGSKIREVGTQESSVADSAPSNPNNP